MARLVPNTLSLEVAAYAILAAVASDTVSKVAIGAVIGRGRFAAEIAVMAPPLLVGGRRRAGADIRVLKAGL
jgi:uncharacterized membrane protein (DUF4010 family)